MKKVLIFVLLFLIYLKSYSQIPKIVWEKTIGGNSSDTTPRIISTSDGGFIIVGASSSNISGDKSEESKGSNDYWIVKINSYGQKLWDKTIGGNSDDYNPRITSTNDGGFVIVGSSISGISGDKSEESKGGYDYWIIKFNNNGQKIWDKTIGGNSDDLHPRITNTIDGGFIIAGHSISGISGDKSEANKGYSDYWIVKINSDGQKVWDKTLGGNYYEDESEIAATSDGGYIIVGNSASGISGDKTEANKGGNDFWVVKLNSSGQKIWDKTIGGDKNDSNPTLSVLSDGDIVVAGGSTSGISGDKSVTNKGGRDYWIIKLNNIGQKIWDNTIGGSDGENSLQITSLSDEGFVIVGVSISFASGDKSEDNEGFTDFWVVKIDNNGQKIWDKNIGGSYIENLPQLAISNDGSFIIVGQSGSGISGDKSEASKGSDDFWVFKLEVPAIDLTAGLVAHYKMDGNAQDVSGNSNHGTAQNGATFGTDRFGNAGKAASFDGVDDWVNCGSNLNFKNSFTISLHSNTKNFGNNPCLFSQGQPVVNGGAFVALINQSVYRFGFYGNDIETGTSFPPLNTWGHYIFTYDISTQIRKIYLNGILISSGTTVPTTATGITAIGKNIMQDLPNGYYNGKLDEIRIYNRALSDSEVAGLYAQESNPNTGKPIVYQLTVPNQVQQGGVLNIQLKAKANN